MIFNWGHFFPLHGDPGDANATLAFADAIVNEGVSLIPAATTEPDYDRGAANLLCEWRAAR